MGIELTTNRGDTVKVKESMLSPDDRKRLDKHFGKKPWTWIWIDKYIVVTDYKSDVLIAKVEGKSRTDGDINNINPKSAYWPVVSGVRAGEYERLGEVISKKHPLVGKIKPMIVQHFVWFEDERKRRAKRMKELEAKAAIENEKRLKKAKKRAKLIAAGGTASGKFEVSTGRKKDLKVLFEGKSLKKCLAFVEPLIGTDDFTIKSPDGTPHEWSKKDLKRHDKARAEHKAKAEAAIERRRLAMEKLSDAIHKREEKEMKKSQRAQSKKKKGKKK